MNATNPYLGISGAPWTPGRNYEYDNTGDRANSANASRPQLTDAQAASYTAQTYLAGSDGWDPAAPRTGRTAASVALRQSSAIGDTRRVARPSIPATCETVTSVRPKSAQVRDNLCRYEKEWVEGLLTDVRSD